MNFVSLKLRIPIAEKVYLLSAQKSDLNSKYILKYVIMNEFYINIV